MSHVHPDRRHAGGNVVRVGCENWNTTYLGDGAGQAAGNTWPDAPPYQTLPPTQHDSRFKMSGPIISRSHIACPVVQSTHSTSVLHPPFIPSQPFTRLFRAQSRDDRCFPQPIRVPVYPAERILSSLFPHLEQACIRNNFRELANLSTLGTRILSPTSCELLPSATDF